MNARAIWRERALPILAFPGLVVLAIALEQLVVIPRARERPPEARIALWERHVEEHPEFAPGHVRLAGEYLVAGRAEEARPHFARALDLDPGDEAAAIGLNAVLRETEGREAAIAQMKAFVAQESGCRPCFQNLAADHLALGRVEEAMRYVQPVIEQLTYVMPANYVMYDHRSDAFMLAGRIYEAAGRAEEAVRFYDIAIERYPRNTQACFLAGRLELASDPAAAVERFRRYRSLEPGDLRGPVFLARALLVSGRYAEAVGVLEEAQRALPGATRVQAERFRGEIGASLEKARRLARTP